VDLIADDLDDLLVAIDGMRVEVQGTEVELATAGVIADVFEMSTMRRILALIADPNIAILLLSIGTLAVVYEAANPGLGFAGIVGVILLLLGFFALAVLPVAAVGLALLILAIALYIGEVFVPGVGVLAAGGTIALLLAGVFLFEGELQVSQPVLWPTALVMGVATTMAGRAALKARLSPATSGAETLIGKPVTVVREEDGRWSAFLEGSWWAVRSSIGELAAGDVMEVVDIEGLELIVEPVGGERES
jgi:membrane-bound serine protease (ClpP class)